MSPKKQRLIFLLGGITFTATAVAIALYGARDSLVYFHSPTDLIEKQWNDDRMIRAGGMVAPQSLTRHHDFIQFAITDGNHDLIVHYQGLLPDLFREGQGVIAEGRMQNDILKADKILAKHDEKYMPPEVARALEKSGYQPPDDKP